MAPRNRDSAPLGANKATLVLITSRAAEVATSPDALIEFANGRVDVLERALLLARFATEPRRGAIQRLTEAVGIARRPQ